jgi:hypothetical protein
VEKAHCLSRWLESVLDYQEDASMMGWRIEISGEIVQLQGKLAMFLKIPPMARVRRAAKRAPGDWTFFYA